MHTTIATIDLFAGIGGIRKGFEETGRFETVYANDFDKHAKTTYDKNFSTSKIDLKDIREVTLKNGSIPKFDFVLSGFPCQPFSIGGMRQGLDDAKGRGTLFEEIIRLLEESKEVYGQLPRGFLLENVKNLKDHDGGRTYKIIVDRLEGLGYHIKSEVLNSLDFGVAQSRQRIYIVGFLNKEDYDAFTWPQPVVTPENYVKVKDILDDYVEPRFYYNGKPLYDKIGEQVTNPDSVYTYRRTYVREQKQGYSPTLVASMGMGGHNVPIIRDSKGMRKLTPMECARLQGYHDLHIPVGMSDQQIYKQIGNSVTVPVLRAIADKVAEALQPVAALEAIPSQGKTPPIIATSRVVMA